MKLATQGLIGMGAVLAACAACQCDRNPAPRATATAVVPACAPAPTAPPPSARPDIGAPRLTSVTERASHLVDVAPGHAPDDARPAGTVFVAAVLAKGERPEATLFEWDVASATTLNPDGDLLYRESDKVDNGKAAEVRIATTSDTLFAAITLTPPSFTGGGFTVIGARGLGTGQGSSLSLYGELPPAKNISIESDGRWLAVAYQRTVPSADSKQFPQMGVALYNPLAMHSVAIIPFHQSAERNLRYDILEMVDHRLFAGEADDERVTVVELEVPTLKVVRKADVLQTPRARGWGHVPVQLTSANGHLMAVSHDTLVELTTDLEVVSKRELHAAEVAVGPAGQLLTPVGLEAPGGRGDFVADARASASCTPAWVGAFALLACTVDIQGVRLARR